MDNTSYFLPRYLNLQSPYPLYIWAVLLSVLGSCIAIYNTGLVNSDGTVYLGAAKAYLDGGWAAAAAYYPKPFYSVSIVFISQLFSISLLYSAYIVNTLLFALLTVCFVDIVWFLTRRSSNQLAIVLFSLLFVVLFPRLNEIKDDVYRDFGLWAFSLLALCFLLRFHDDIRKFYFLIFWFFSQLLAGFYKNEGYLLLSSVFFLFFYEFSVGLLFSEKYTAKVKVLFFIVLAVVFLALFCFFEYYSFFKRLDLVFHKVSSRGDILADVFLNKHSEEYGFSLVLIASFWIVFCEFLKAFDLSIFVVGFMFFKNIKKYKDISPVLMVYFVLSIAVVSLFAIEAQFLVGRYVTFSVILFALIVFVLSNNVGINRKSITLFSFFFIVQFFDSFVSFGYSREYVEDAVAWVDDNIDAEKTVISNRRGFTYSVDRALRLQHLSMDNPVDNVVKKYDYYVFLTKKKGHSLNDPRFLEIKRFENKKKHSATIYKAVNL